MMALLEWFGAATGIIGALLLAANFRLSPWAFVIYLLSCAAWIAFGLLTSAPGRRSGGHAVGVCGSQYVGDRWLVRKPVG